VGANRPFGIRLANVEAGVVNEKAPANGRFDRRQTGYGFNAAKALVMPLSETGTLTP
jgi:hypothetical protein